MDKLNISFTQKSDKTDKISKNKQNDMNNNLIYEIDNDDFVKSEVKNDLAQEFASRWSNLDLKEFVSDMMGESAFWTDGANFAGFQKLIKDDSICDVSMGLLNLNTAEVDVKEISLEEFKEIYSAITAKHIIDHPENEELYKNLYIKLLKYIDKHRSKES